VAKINCELYSIERERYVYIRRVLKTFHVMLLAKATVRKLSQAF
jgi:hypothetical protein